MTTRTVTLEKEGGIFTLTLNRPPVNALGRELVEELDRVVSALAKDAKVRVLIVTGAGMNFCAGADLKERQGMSEADVRRWVPFLNGTFQKIARLPFPTIAAINGVAAGGGFELALACDFRIAEEFGQVGLKETSLAIIPGAGGTQRLARLVGPARAKRWIFTARLYGTASAKNDGAVDRVASPGGAVKAARAFAQQIAVNAPIAIRQAKLAIDAGYDLPLEKALEVEIKAYEGVIPTEDRREAIAAFNAKRAPVWKGK